MPGTAEQDTQKIQDNACAEKIYCANCSHCKLVTAPGGSTDQFYLRVRCNAGKWRKKLGEEKFYKYFSIMRRSIEYCDRYEEMGAPEEFMKELRRSLPVRDETYDMYTD
ncbi:MAG: hypothetical protein LBR47_02630 [Spirochaetaceae bacterium]|nr:hypothetical protein [Spirochaetaceae bacterium]